MWVGRWDVDKLLEEMTPGQFNEWWGAYRAGLFRDDWEQAGVIACEIRNGLGMIRRGLNDKSITDKYFTTPSDYDPTRVADIVEEQKKTDQTSIDRFASAVKAAYGNGSGNR